MRGKCSHLMTCALCYDNKQQPHKLNLHTQGIDTDLIGVHSLRAGGAMAMKLNGSSDTSIKKQGRWSSLTFLQYIHNQIAHLTKDLSTKMSTPLSYVNVAHFAA